MVAVLNANLRHFRAKIDIQGAHLDLCSTNDIFLKWDFSRPIKIIL